MATVRDQKIGRLEIAGIFFIVLLGSFLHFLFELSGNWTPLAVIAAVNESTWEHLKLAFWPALFWGLIEWPYLRAVGNFCWAKAIGLILMPVLVVVFFYGYLAILGQDYLAMDIGIFIIAVITGQLVSWRIMRFNPWRHKNTAITIIILLIAVFSLLTFYAPCNFLFVDPHSGEVGLNAVSHHDHDENITVVTSELVDQVGGSSVTPNQVTDNGALPLSQASERITKKPFGIWVQPTNSPVSSERFTGFHTGTDFEILSGEENSDVPVQAICDGEVTINRQVDGYGGVIVQQCQLENQDVLILYGHLATDHTDSATTGQVLAAGEVVSYLAPAGSQYAGGERKHLHLGIIRGQQIDWRGYVDQEDELGSWMDYTRLQF